MAHFLAAIDGACSGNGKPDCLSASSSTIIEVNVNTVEDVLKRFTVSPLKGINNFVEADIFTRVSKGSTSQRGEIEALIDALEVIRQMLAEKYYVQSLTIVTDSIYIRNTIRKGWLYTWASNGWVTSGCEDVKNEDLWAEVLDHIEYISKLNCELNIIHTKGHILSIGEKTAFNIIQSNQGDSCKLFVDLYEALSEKLQQVTFSNAKVANAILKYPINNEVPQAPSTSAMSNILILNAIADYLATYTLYKYKNNNK